MSALISIIMPVRNGQPYLKACLDSILIQSYQNWELLVVNDHSTDFTSSILEEYSNNDSRIKPLKNKGKGIIDALNTGYNQSSGAYITRMDADDLMPPDKLIELYKPLRDTKKSVSTGYVNYFSKEGVKDGYRKYETWLNQLCDWNKHYSAIYAECVIPSPCWMMHRDDFESIGGFSDRIYPEDYDLVFRMYKHDIKVLPILKILHHWRDHGARASRNDKNYSDNRFLDIKLQYFIEIEIPKWKQIILVGAGKKGKHIAHKLKEENITFTWLTDNPRKIGINIYGLTLENYTEYDFNIKNACVMVALGNEEDKKEVRGRILGSIENFVAHYFS